MNTKLTYLLLVAGFLLYSVVSIFTKSASLYAFLSLNYCLNLITAVVLLGLYAVLWQQILKRMDVSDAYMFKGLTVVFVLVLAGIFFNETITVQNGIGAILIISGIALHAKS